MMFRALLSTAAFATSLAALDVAPVLNDTTVEDPTADGLEHFCDILKPVMQAGCKCSDKGNQGVVTCPLESIGPIGFTGEMDLKPCEATPRMDMYVKDNTLGVHWRSKSVVRGEPAFYPIGNMYWRIPVVGKAQAYGALKIDGPLSSMSVEVGVDFCISIPIVGKKCGESIYHGLPLWIVHAHNLNFSKLCSKASEVPVLV